MTLSTFDPSVSTWGGGRAWGAGTNMSHPDLTSYEPLPAPSGHTDSHNLDTYIWGEVAWEGSDIRSMSSI